MKSIPYNCKFCRKLGMLKIHESEFTQAIESLLPLAACNRCADFQTAKNRIKDQIKDTSIRLCRSRLSSPKNLSDVEAGCRSKFTDLTRKLAKLACDHLRITTVWDCDWVDQLIEHPGRWEFICTQYMKGVSQLAREAFANNDSGI